MAQPQGGGAAIRRVARENLGYDRLRPGQEDAIGALLAGRDTLAVMPTGSGKSAIYQIAGGLLDGPTLVISPLIALQRDQMLGLAGQGAGGAIVVNSHMAPAGRDAALARLCAGDGGVEFVFLAPEQFNNDDVLDCLRRVRPSLFVVDEAHCISEWGHDFRPDYLRLGAVIEELGHPTVLALTATASPPVRAEIVERLDMRDARVIVRGFDRPNIALAVRMFNEEWRQAEALLDAVLGAVAAAERPGIVYVATRAHAEEIAAQLRGRGVRACHYHAGMRPADREAAQRRFMGDEAEVIVSTTAFGMGVDKPNVRFVFHFDISDSLDAYYQEIGRAGRDGRPARAVLFYRPADVNIHRFFAGGGKVEPEQVMRVAKAALERGGPVGRRELAARARLSQAKVAAALGRLEELGLVRILPSGEAAPGDRMPSPGELWAAAQAAADAQEQRRRYERSRIEMMQNYAEVRDCRREFLLNYFGEEYAPPCANCDNCLAGLPAAQDVIHQPFPLNSRVAHAAWGGGIVTRYEGDKIVVLFDTVGYKTLDLELVTARGLLRTAG